MENRIILNSIKTPDGTVLVSRHRHDYVTHTDKNGFEYMVDGGNEYLRRSVNNEAPYEDLSLHEDSPFEVIREHYCRGSRGKDGTQPLTWIPLKDMDDEYLLACIEYNSERGMGKGFANKMYAKELDHRQRKQLKDG